MDSIKSINYHHILKYLHSIKDSHSKLIFQCDMIMLILVLCENRSVKFVLSLSVISYHKDKADSTMSAYSAMWSYAKWYDYIALHSNALDISKYCWSISLATSLISPTLIESSQSHLSYRIWTKKYKLYYLLKFVLRTQKSIINTLFLA